MKIYFSIVALILCFSFSFLSEAKGIDLLVNQAGGDASEIEKVLPSFEAGHKTAEEKINSVFYTIIETILILSGTIAVIMFVVAGFKYTVSSLDNDLMESAKKMMFLSVMGLLVVIFSYAIFTNVIGFLESAE